MTKHQWLWMGCATWFLAGTGCSRVDTPTTTDYDDVAQALGGVAATGDGGGEVGTLFDVSAIASGSPADGIALSGSGEFSGTRVGLKYDYAVRCSDAAGTALETCSAGTDSAAVTVAWSGQLDTAVLDATATRDGKLELSEIRSGTIHVTGASSLDLDAQFDALLRDASRSYRLKYRADYRDLRVQLKPARVLGGSIQYAVEVDRTASNRARQASSHFEMDAELTFGADGTAKLTIDGEHHYQIDTQSGAAARASN